MRVLFVNGTGRAAGEGLPGADPGPPCRRSDSAWAARLAAWMEARLINAAEPGRGIAETLRTSIEGVERLLERGIAAADLFACIAWPIDQRLEILTDRGFLRRPRSMEEDAEMATLHGALQSFLLLQSHLERRGVAYVMACADALPGVSGDPRRAAPERCAYLARAIRWDQFLWDRDRPMGLQSWAFRMGHIATPNDPWPVEAHADFVARVIGPWIERHAPTWRGRSDLRSIGSANSMMGA